MDFCTTVYKYQGDTIVEDFTIHDWNLMSKKLRYTAVSRAKTVSQINIKLSSRAIQFRNVEQKTNGYYRQDAAAGRFCNLTVDYVNNLLKNQLCAHCHEVCTNEGGSQWTVDRKDDSLGHVIGNCVLSCLSCNQAKRK